MFLGRDYGHEATYSDEIAGLIDDEVRRLVDHAHDRARFILTTHRSTLDRLAAFQETIFSSQGVRSLAIAMETGMPLPDPDPELTPLEQDGKGVFIRACAQCHGNDRDHPSQSTPVDQVFSTTTPPAVLRYHTIRSTCPRPAGFGFAQCSPQMMKNVRTSRSQLVLRKLA